MFFQVFAVSALLLLLLAGTTATVTAAPPECHDLGTMPAWSEIGNNETITSAVTALCETMTSLKGCDYGCLNNIGCIDITDKYSVYIYYYFDEKVYNITTMPCMEYFNQTREACERGGQIAFMVRDDAVLNGTQVHGNFTTYPYPNKCL